MPSSMVSQITSACYHDGLWKLYFSPLFDGEPDHLLVLLPTVRFHLHSMFLLPLSLSK
jgi:hypothetical protein